jgi:hypothetical protein
MTGCSLTRAILFSVLPGLILTMSLPAPASLHEVFGGAITAACDGQGPLRDDSELPDGETSLDDFWLPTNARRRSTLVGAPNGVRTQSPFGPSTVLDETRACRLWLTRVDAGDGHDGHFLADGRALRLWFQSQTC